MNDGLKVPPHSVQAEQAVIGGLMLDNAAWAKVANVLVENDFYHKKHRYLFSVLKFLLSCGDSADVVTVSEFIESRGHADKIDLVYLVTLARDTPSAANIGNYAGIVRDKALIRQVIRLGNKFAACGYGQDGVAGMELVRKFRNEVFMLHQESLSRG